ncbi:murein hydrolase activator EnvC family protein [Nitrospinota bacterium]
MGGKCGGGVAGRTFTLLRISGRVCLHLVLSVLFLIVGSQNPVAHAGPAISARESPGPDKAALRKGSNALERLEREIQKEENRLGRIEARLALERDRKAKGRLQTESLLSHLDRLSARLAAEDQRLRLLARKVRRSELRREKIREKIDKLGEEQEERRSKLRVRLRALYMGGSAGNVRLVVMAGSVWDMLDRWTLATRLARHDQLLIHHFREAEEVLRRLEEEAAAEVRSRAEFHKKQARSKARVAKYYARRSRRLARLEKDRARRGQLMIELGEARDAMRDAIASLLKARASRIDRDAALFDKMEGRLPWPVAGTPLLREGGTGSRGIRIRAPRGSPVKSVAPGEVMYSDWVRGYGRLLILRHGEGIYTVYGGAEEVLVERGEKVGPEQMIARVGTTGVLGDPALYFEIRRGSIPLEPMRWLSPRR